MAGEYVLQTKGLTKEFRGFTAVKNVNLNVRRGSIHALIGPNGAGKTTCFNLITKFLPPSSGRIFYEGRDITSAPAHAIARLGLGRSFQISAVFPHLSVLENVRVALQRALGASYHFWRSEKSVEVLNGRAMELLDDAMAGMGAEDIARTSALIKRVSKDRTVLMVEHNLSVVANLSDTITVLARGEVLAEGPYAEVSKNPQVIEAYMGTGHG